MACDPSSSAGQCPAEGQAAFFPLTSLPGFRLLSLSSVTLILLLICLPPLHNASRSIFRPTVLFHVERGLEWVVLAQKNQRKILTTLCSLSCFTVSIAFYLTFLPLLIWVRPPSGDRLCDSHEMPLHAIYWDAQAHPVCELAILSRHKEKVLHSGTGFWA